MAKYDEERVPQSSLQVGDLVRPPLSFGSVMRVTKHFECGTNPGWYHCFLEGVEGLVTSGEAYLNGDAGITLLHPTTTFVAMKGKEWLNSIGVK